MSSSQQRRVLLLELRRTQQQIERDFRSASPCFFKQQPLWRRCLHWLAPRS